MAPLNICIGLHNKTNYVILITIKWDIVYCNTFETTKDFVFKPPLKYSIP